MANGSIPRREFSDECRGWHGGNDGRRQFGAGASRPARATAATRPADLILKNAKVITIDARSSIAQAIAIAGDKILAVGPDAAMAAHTAPGTRVLDLKRRTVTPGLIDGHAHMDREALRNVFPALGKVRSIKDIQDRIAELARGKKPGEWIVTMPIGDPPYYFDVPEHSRREALADAAGAGSGRAEQSGLHPLDLGLLARHVSARLLRQHRGAQARRHHPRHRLAGRRRWRSRRTATATRPASSSSRNLRRSRR